MRVYVSGPIKLDPDHRAKFAAAEGEAEWLLRIQRMSPLNEVVNPLDVPACGASPCRWPGEMLPTGHTWECYIRNDISRLVTCDAIYMMRGWESSKGATEERRIAKILALQVLYQSGAHNPENVPAADRRPHSRACGWKKHDHGTNCSNNCPSCGGRNLPEKEG